MGGEATGDGASGDGASGDGASGGGASGGGASGVEPASGGTGAASDAGADRGGPPSSLRRVCVFCGSSDAVAPRYFAGARAVGTALARRGIGVVYGGGRVGLMGALAEAALAEGGEVIGIIPERLVTKEVAHHGVTELIVVPGMHERKRRMAELADGFLALAGGLGTLEELFEVATWSLLGYHRKPIALLNEGGYFDGLLAFLDHATREGFIHAQHRGLIGVGQDVGKVIDRLERLALPVTGGRASLGDAT